MKVAIKIWPHFDVIPVSDHMDDDWHGVRIIDIDSDLYYEWKSCKKRLDRVEDEFKLIINERNG